VDAPPVITTPGNVLRRNRQVTLTFHVGAGKSTLIKLLIELRGVALKGHVPVVGSPDESIPTSGDVHLYVDPKSHLTDYPLLYADCEGLEEGEREPIAIFAKKEDSRGHEHDRSERRTGSFAKKLRRKHHSSQREISWADNEERRCREFFVTNLYPRLLYTFSDVIVFVLKNPRSVSELLN